MKYLSCDLRALAFMRLAVAAIIMTDLTIRLGDLEVFYSNTGAFPLTMVFEHLWNDYFVSLHAISGLWQVQLVLFLFAYFCAAMLFIGYRTRLFTVLSWFMLLSLHNRNTLILQGGDDLLRMVLFWAMFIPWGARYSCDRLLNREKPQPMPPPVILTVATIAYLLQICYIYSGSALLKGPEWNTNYTALYYAYSLDQIAYPLTKWFYYYPELLKKMTALAYYFELLAPILFFIPVKHGFFRTIGVVSIIGFHLFNSMNLFIGLFPLIGCGTVLGLLPSSAMDKLERWFKSLKPLIIQSFRGFAMLAQKIIRWKEPLYYHAAWRENLKTAFLIFLTIFVFDWNFSNISIVTSKLSDQLRFIGYGLRLDQNWGMFAPGVFKDDGWYVLEGITEKGKSINLLDPKKTLSYKKPENIVSMFKNDRWRKYSENLIMSFNAYARGYFCSYYKRTWNEAHPEQRIGELRMYYMSELTKPDYQYSKPEKIMLWQCGP
jgi:hypothetical protein